MTFAEAFREACAVDPNDDVKLQVEVWRMFGEVRGLEWSIFSDKLGNHYKGPTPEIAIAAYRTAARPNQEVPKNLDAVGEIGL